MTAGAADERDIARSIKGLPRAERTLKELTGKSGPALYRRLAQV